MSANLFDRLAATITDPARPAITTPDGAVMTYADLIAATGRMANTLTDQGFQPGDRLAAQVEKSREALILYLATVRAGGVFLPLNPAYTGAEMEYFLTDAEPALVVRDPGRAQGLTLDAQGHGTLTDLAATQPSDFATVPRAGNDLAALLYTSGTTGRAKGAMLSHDNLVSNTLTLIDLWRHTRDDVLIHALPVFHTHGLFVATNITLFSGGSLILLPRFDPRAVLDAMPRATVLMGVPTFYTRLLAEPGLTREATESMRLFVSGSAPLLAETHRAFQERTGHVILERYGMTETNMNTSNPYEGPRVPGTAGRPLPGVEVIVTDPVSGDPLPQGEIGMIEVRGPNVFQGYWRMPDKTAAELRANGFFITGDLGRMDENGYLHIVGRAKDLVISGGFNIYPKEIETEIDVLPGVIESAVIGVPHPDLGEAVVAVVVGETTEDAVLSALGDRLARFKQPRRVIVVPDLPRNAMGKVQKNLLRAAHAGLF